MSTERARHHGWVLPGNKWHHLDGVEPLHPRSVSVIIPYYNQPASLARALAALTAQTYPAALMQVVVADDGSRHAPVTGEFPWPITVVRQPDRGFRAAAARNLGVQASSGELLAFLDPDMIPEPDYLHRLMRLPGLTSDALVVGRRRHGEFTDWTPAMVGEWLRHRRPGPKEFTEPAWLRDEYVSTANLSDVGPLSYRYVISAVMGCSRSFFDEVGGFDDTFVGYGGEDWDFAHRSFCAGAVLAHIPEAVAWHDGPDWAGRGTPQDRDDERRAQAEALSRRIPDLTSSEPGQPPNVVIRADRAWAGGLAATVLDVIGSPPGGAQLVYFDETDPGTTRSARIDVRLDAPLAVSARAWDFLTERLLDAGLGRVRIRVGEATLTATATRAAARADRWADTAPGADLVADLFGDITVDGSNIGVAPLRR